MASGTSPLKGFATLSVCLSLSGLSLPVSVCYLPYLLVSLSLRVCLSLAARLSVCYSSVSLFRCLLPRVSVSVLSACLFSFVSVFLVFLFVCPSLLPVCLSLSVCLCVSVVFGEFVCLLVRLSLLCVSFYVCLSVCLTVASLSVCPCDCFFLSLSLAVFAYVAVSLWYLSM